MNEHKLPLGVEIIYDDLEFHLGRAEIVEVDGVLTRELRHFTYTISGKTCCRPESWDMCIPPPTNDDFNERKFLIKRMTSLSSKILKNDLHTRRFVFPYTNGYPSKIPPCPGYLQGLVRDSMFHLYVYMRSQHILHLPYDVLTFFAIRDAVVEEIDGNVKPGSIVVTVGSLHMEMENASRC
jgi:hypothetical protein